jgi:NAD+ synthase (glutamine-hydrolysing)
VQCASLGVRLLTVPIEAPFQGFLDALAPEFEGVVADTTEENLQSRSRGALMMALSNKFGGLLLTTGNKSEYAVGYATIYGDMCGGYAPLKDLYKTEVFALARWRNTVGGSAPHGGEVIPTAVIERPPSAELRENQRDQDSLPPYDVLDAILLRHVDQEQSAAEIIAAGFDAATVERVVKLVRTSEWKRHQAAPGRRCRGARSGASAAIRSATATGKAGERRVRHRRGHQCLSSAECSVANGFSRRRCEG